MFHENIEQLKILLSLLEYELNDIYIHADKKMALSDSEKNEISSSLKKSNCCFIESQYGAWGGDSLMKIEINLLKKATEIEHKYYHLLSGSDLPLKTQSYIHNILKNDGRDYLGIDDKENELKLYLHRFRYYYFLQNWCGKNNHIIIKKIQSASILIQKIFKINRLRNVKFELVKSEQWFSITHNTAEYVLEQYPRYKKYFLHSFIPDESFIYTIINDSYLVNNMEKISLRYIDWNRGGPYIFGIDDFDELINSPKLYARKFDINHDREIIIRIHNYLMNLS